MRDKEATEVRRAAILIASLDAKTGKQLLAQLPPDMARQVRSSLTQLGNIDPAEQRRIIDSFRRQAAQASKPSASNANASQGSTNRSNFSEPHRSPLQLDATDNTGSAKTAAVISDPNSAETQIESPDSNDRPWIDLSIDSLVPILIAERPIMAAVVMSHLTPASAGELLERLPDSLQTEVLEQLCRLEQVEADILEEILDHLRKRTINFKSIQKSKTTSNDRLQQILLAVDSEARTRLSDELVRRGKISRELYCNIRQVPADAKVEHEQLDAGPTILPFPQSSAEDTLSNAPSKASSPVPSTGDFGNHHEANQSIRFDRSGLASRDELSSHHEEYHTIPFHGHIAGQGTEDNRDIATEFEALTDLPPADLAWLIQTAEPQLVLLAISGSSLRFMTAIDRLLDGRDRKRLRRHLNELGTIPLRDVERAQRELLSLATTLFGGVADNVQGQTITFRAVA